MLVFLSHSGSDTEAAKTLKERIVASPAAREAGLRIWLDIDELRPGDEWQPALEAALERADAVMVYVGDKGVVNWVDREMRHAMTRATGPGAIPFVPVLASDALDPAMLPPFMRQFQAVTDPVGDERALAALVGALVSGTAQSVALTDRPFVGLKAMGEAEADRFFGRDAEIAELVDRVRRHHLVAVVADSGAGKSSLVRAGLVPAFRGGALLSEHDLRSPVPRHVVVMRPGADPRQGLKDGIDRAARALGRDAATRRSLRQSVRAYDPGETFYALACDIDHDAPDILLVIDQFEELLTATPRDLADAFVRLVMDLVAHGPRRIRVVLTVRVDYFNLIRRHEALFDRLEAKGGAAQFRLKRVSDEGLDEIVKRPLIMAGHADASERDALAAAIRRDVTGRPGDLALVQMALYATWRRAVETGADLMSAYTQAGGVLGALAHQAEETRQGLTPEEQAVLVSLFARLVRLGDTGGATRRVAILSELDPARAALAQRLATEEAGRLLMVSDKTVEISHEALVAQWPWLQEQIQAGAQDIRTLARLGDRTAAWKTNGTGALPNDVEREAFDGLAQRHADWLSQDERACLAAAKRRATLRRLTGIAAMMAIVAFGAIAGVMAWRAIEAERQAVAALHDARTAEDRANEALELSRQRQKALRDQSLVLEEETRRKNEEAQRATAALAEAARNAAGGLVALSIIAANEERWSDAVKLSLAAWPRSEDGFGVQLPDPIDTLSRALPELWQERMLQRQPDAGEPGFLPGNRAFETWLSQNGKMMGARETDGRVRIYRVPSGRLVATLSRDRAIGRLTFAPDGSHVAVDAYPTKLSLIDLSDAPNLRDPVSLPVRKPGLVATVQFSDDGEIVALAGGSPEEQFVMAFGTERGEVLLDAEYTGSHVDVEIAFSQDGSALWLEAGGDDAGGWFALDGSNLELDRPPPRGEVDKVQEFLRNLASGSLGGDHGIITQDASRLAVLNRGAVDVYDTATGTILARLEGRFADILGFQFLEPDTLHGVTTSGRISTWDLADIAEGNAFEVACRLLPDTDLEYALRGYPIVQNDPICGPDYAPPLPDWMDVSHAAIGYVP